MEMKLIIIEKSGNPGFVIASSCEAISSLIIEF